MKKLFIILLCFILLFVSGCKDDENINPNFGGEIKLFAYTPDTLNPLATTYKTNASLLTALLYKTPLVLNPDYTVSPCLVESWSFADNGMTCVLKIRSDVFFSDGTPLTATHVKNSMDEAMRHENNLYYGISKYVQSSSASQNTLTINLKKAGSDVLRHLIFPVVKDTDSLIGCGLYILSEHTKNGLTLNAVTNENAIFKPNIAKAHIKFYPKSDMWANGFLTSETDVITADMAVLSKLTSKTNITAKDYTTDTFTYLGFNNQSTILPDENSRKAIGYLIDKTRMLDTLFVGYALNTNSPFKPGTAYSGLYDGDFNANTELSKEYLNQSSAEYLGFSILVNEESDTKKKVADYIAERLNENGMNVTVITLPFEEYLKNIEEGNYTAYIGEVNVSQDQDFKFLLHSAYNNLYYNSSYMDELLENFSSTLDENQKKIYAQEIHKLILNQAPIISLYYQTNVFMVNDNVKGEFTPMPNDLYRGIDTWIAK